MDIKKKEIYEAKEFLEETGQESEERARKVVGQYHRAEVAKQEGKRAFFLEKLDSRKKYNDYNSLCAKITVYFLEEEDLPKFIQYRVQFDTKGVLLFATVGKRIFQRAFRSTRDPLYDLNACQVFAASVGDLAQLKNGRTNKPKQA